MNVDNSTPPGSEHYRSLQILDELSNNDSLTQRDLSSRLGIALGLVNSYIKNLVKKGFITVKTIPSKRYAYYLTPQGFTEKTRLTYHMLSDYTRIYRDARKNLKVLFQELSEVGIKNVIFAGTDEVAEIAYLSLQETDLRLAGVVDMEQTNVRFINNTVQHIEKVRQMEFDCIVITTYLKRDQIYKELLKNGVRKERIRTIGMK